MKVKLTLVSASDKLQAMIKNSNSCGKTRSSDRECDQNWNTSSLISIYEASLFLKTVLNDVRYQLAHQFVGDIVSDPPSVMRSYICVHLICGQLESHRNYLSAIHIVFLYYWDVVRKDNIINKVLVDLYNSFDWDNAFVTEIVVRADKCLQRIEKEMRLICTAIKMANFVIWQYQEELFQISRWADTSTSTSTTS